MNIIEKLGDQSIILYQLFFLNNYLVFKNNYSLIMFITIFINIFINLSTKHYLMNAMKSKNHRIPILGTFFRPKYKTMQDKLKSLTITDYGMPSGHSQIASFIPAFYYFAYINNDFSIQKFTILFVISISIMYTRFTSKMHTIQQITIGSIFGIIIAYVISKITFLLGLS